jgi:hypothetical protein
VALFAGDLVEFGIGEHWAPAVGIISVFGLLAASQPLRLQLGRLLPGARRHEAGGGLGVGEPCDDARRDVAAAARVRARRLRSRDGVNTLVSLVVRVHFLLRLFPGFEMLRHAAAAVAPTVPPPPPC